MIATVISVVAAIGVLVVLPEDYWMINKIGKNLFFIFVAGIVFLSIQLLIKLLKAIGNMIDKVKNLVESQKLDEQKNKENLEVCLSFGDKLNPSERNLLIQFIKTNNSPIVEKGYRMYNSNSIFSTDYIVTTMNSDGSRSVKLKEDFYQLMKAVYEKCGSISHFD